MTSMSYTVEMPRLAPVSKTIKSQQPDIDPQRALKTIRILGAITLVLIVVAAGGIWWGSRGADALRIIGTAQQDHQAVKVFMEARMSSNGKAIRSGDTVTDPTVSVHGVLSDYARLREGLDGLAVTIRGTRADILPETGEFNERFVLDPGKNEIEFGVWWEGREWQRTHAQIFYNKAADPTPAPGQPPL